MSALDCLNFKLYLDMSGYGQGSFYLCLYVWSVNMFCFTSVIIVELSLWEIKSMYLIARSIFLTMPWSIKQLRTIIFEIILYRPLKVLHKNFKFQIFQSYALNSIKIIIIYSHKFPLQIQAPLQQRRVQLHRKERIQERWTSWLMIFLELSWASSSC